jgi:lipoprotein-releasing system permease protein
MLPIKIAFRFLKSSLGQTILIALGISVGVSVQVFIGSLIGGLQNDLVNTTIGSSSQITVVHSDNTLLLENYQELTNDINTVEGINNVSYSLSGSGTLINDTKTYPILLRGFNLNLSEGIYDFEEKITSGTMPTGNNEVILGADLVKELSLSLGETVTLQIPLVGESDVTLVGIYDFNVSTINNLWVVSNLPTTQNILDTGDKVSNIEMQLDDVFLAEEVALKVENELDNNDIEVSNWIEQNGELLSGLQAQGSSSLMIQVFVTISVVLGITSVLAITVIQKSKQIGILKAMGIKDRTASLIFLSQGFILGILGAIGGVLLGLGLTYAFFTFAVDADGNPVINLLIDPNFIALSAGIAVLSSSIASIIPARKSSKLTVIEVIRNG